MIKTCPICNTEFKVKPSHFERRKYCSFKCKGTSQLGKATWSKGKTFSEEYRKKLSDSHIGNPGYWTGKKFSKERCKKMSELMKGRKFNRKKSEFLMGAGYVNVYRPNHPRANNTGYVPQHRLIAEKYIGRPIIKPEVVHHINENKRDNSKENLFIFENNVVHLAFHLLVRKNILPLSILRSNLNSYK